MSPSKMRKVPVRLIVLATTLIAAVGLLYPTKPSAGFGVVAGAFHMGTRLVASPHLVDGGIGGIFGRRTRHRPVVCPPAVPAAGHAAVSCCVAPPLAPQHSTAASVAAQAAPDAADQDAASQLADAPETGWQPLFDGKTLSGWKATNFGGEGEVGVEQGSLILEMGYSLTGVTYTGEELPTTNYELSLEAKRLEGGDFFCGLTFPVADSHCSLIVGGWAGGVVGLSSIDRRDASENDTTRYKEFQSDRWYRIRVVVTPDRIQAWIDDEKFVDQDIRDKQISTRPEVDLSKPLGIAAYETKAAVRNIRLRRVDEQR